jgi:hypothetical protein
MSLDKGIKYGKEWRAPYRRSQAFDKSCRPNGGCPFCKNGRKHKDRKREARASYREEGSDEGHYQQGASADQVLDRRA